MQNHQKAFTLIELLIALAIVGIIAAIAYPSYQNSIRKTNRSEAKTELVDVAQRLQRCYTLYAKFNDTNCAIYADLAANRYVTRGGNYYRITIAPSTSGGDAATTYKLTATAIKSPQTLDTANDCNKMELDHTGVKKPEVCW